jgi:hypothetical protein
MVWLLLVLVVAVGCGVSMLITWAVDHIRHSDDSSPDDDPVGIKIGAAFGMYGVIIGFAVIVAQQGYTDAQASLREEVGAVMSVLHVAHAIPPDVGDPVLDAVRNYLTAEIAGWDTFAQEEIGSRSATSLDGLYEAAQGLGSEPATLSAQQSLFASLSQIDAGRTDRILVSRDGTPMLLWVLLIGGGILVLSMAALLNFSSLRLRLLLLLGMGALISVALYTIWALADPFTGPIPIDFEPLQHALANI